MGKRGFAKLQGQRDIKTLFRYQEMFRLSEEEILNLFASVPFLNGGLFECLDKTKKIDAHSRILKLQILLMEFLSVLDCAY